MLYRNVRFRRYMQLASYIGLYNCHHRQIYNAVLSRQTRLGIKAATNHIRDVRNSLQEIEQEEQRLIRVEMWSNDISDTFNDQNND